MHQKLPVSKNVNFFKESLCRPRQRHDSGANTANSTGLITSPKENRLIDRFYLRQTDTMHRSLASTHTRGLSMNIIDLKFEALSIFTRLETQLACLQMRLPVPNYDGDTYNTNSPTTEPFTYWESYLVREAFYQMFRHTDEITVFCQMLEWLDERNDEESLSDGLTAVKRIQQLVENKMRDEITKEG